MRHLTVTLLALLFVLPAQAQVCHQSGVAVTVGYGAAAYQQRHSAHHAAHHAGQFAAQAVVVYPPDDSLEREIGRLQLEQFRQGLQADVLRTQQQIEALRLELQAAREGSLKKGKGGHACPPQPQPTPPAPPRPAEPVQPEPQPQAQSAAAFSYLGVANCIGCHAANSLKADGKHKGGGHVLFDGDAWRGDLTREEITEVHLRVVKDKTMPPAAVGSKLTDAERWDLACEPKIAAALSRLNGR